MDSCVVVRTERGAGVERERGGGGGYANPSDPPPPPPPAYAARRCEVEITGIARCNVKTMWMKGESFGLFEAVIELFGDEEGQDKDKDTQGTEANHPPGPTDIAAEASGRGAFALRAPGVCAVVGSAPRVGLVWSESQI